ncbi:MAG TPA: hypothetical protein PLF84_18880 [Bryobacteraceae bacterium]|nr:hypothetical protein [Bryobacteraceae bacterium]
MRVLSLLFLLIVPVLAQNDPVRGKQIVDEAIAALGGPAYLNMRDRVEQGRGYSFYREQLSGLSRTTLYTRYLTRPEPPPAGYIGQRERQAFGKNQDIYIVFNEMGGHEITFRGAKPLPPDTMERWQESLRHNILHTLRCRLGEPGLVFEFVRTDTVDNAAVNVVDVVDSDSRVTTVYFEQISKLPVRQSWFRRDPRTRRRIEEITVYAKFRDIGGGVQWPFVVRRERNGEKIFEMFSDDVKLNQDLTDDLFTLSGDVKIIDPKAKRRR